MEKSNASAGEDNPLPADDDQPVYSSKTVSYTWFTFELEKKMPI